MSKIILVIKSLLYILPFVLLALWGNKNNLKKQDRSRQCYMPIVAVAFCIVAGLLLNPLVELVLGFFNHLPLWINSFARWLGGLFGGKLRFLANLFRGLAGLLAKLIRKMDLVFWAQVLVNALIAIIYMIFKRIVILILKGICKDGVGHYERFARIAYTRNKEDGRFYIKDHLEQGVTLAKTMYYACMVFGVIGLSVSVFLFKYSLLSSLYYPVFGVIAVGEVFFFLDGPRKTEERSSLTGEAENATKVCDYTFMRKVLGRLFGDKLMSDNTSVNSDLLNFKTNGEMLEELIEDDRTAVEVYGRFMKKKAADGLEIDQNYLASGLSLLNGKSVVFNNPFYYDLMPYIFFPMNRTILRRKKVLIILGRHAIEKDLEQWCRQGLASVNGLPSLWDVSVLSDEAKDPDVGIITRSSVHDLRMHEQNAAFFKEVEFVVLIEPSRLIATAQIGLNSLIRHCRRDGKKIVFCSTDKNSDGLVDALSHVLMTSLEEVTATNKHKGTSSYMCWEADEEHLQHRLLPNLSRYLGVGTELSFTGLKNQVSKVSWYGGDAFPVQDMHWIAKQYYYDLLRYASVPADQTTFDEVFTTSPNMWNAQVRDNNYLTVEDESNNMYEVKRAFSTRATNQGFVNVISTDYLLKDYMAANDGIFDADSKAIPNIVADYAHTERNVVYRLCMRLMAYPLLEKDIRQEMALINIDLGEDLIGSLWQRICDVARGAQERVLDPETGKELLQLNKGGVLHTFDQSVIKAERKYSFKTGKMEIEYTIADQTFVDVFLADLCSAEYLAEDETDSGRFLGTELRGHVFQKYLPGQFFTFGGKYYEMLRLTLDGRVMVRRAADHINGRPQYRQVRNYRLLNAVNSAAMGDQKDIGGISVIKQYADIQVDTPAYWRMKRYNDFSTGKKVEINGVPTRTYYNKQLLRIDFPEALVKDKKTVDTIALLMNEVFRTLYAENQGMIVAVTAGQAEAPLSYSLDGENLADNSLYIIEDSQMDIGYLVSVERNLTRIFSIICDYLEWHGEALEKSMNPPEPPEKTDYSLTDAQRQAEEQEEQERLAAEKKKKGIRGFFRKIGGFFKKIGAFFKGLFKRKPKKEKPPKGAQPQQVPDQDYMMIYGKPHKKVNGKWVPCSQEEFDEKMAGRHQIIDDNKQAEKEAKEREKAEQERQEPAEDAPVEAPSAQDTPAEETPAEAVEETGKKAKKKGGFFGRLFGGKKKAAKEESVEEEVPTEETPTEEIPAEEIPAEETPAEEAPAEEASSEEETEHPVLLNVAPPSWLFNMAPPVEETPTEEASAEEVPAEETPVEEIPAEEAPAEEAPNEEAPAEEAPEELKRKPYHERYYLLFGGEEEPQTIDTAATLDLLRQLGFGKNALEQARNGLSENENMERNYVPNRKGSRFCDFCGTEIFGSEYEVLVDGRERCMICGRTAVKTEKEFKNIYKDVIRNLSVFFGITINASVDIRMVNAKALHKHLGETFIPTGNSDGRVLGVAIKDKKGNYSILLENGSPRLSATMTMVHELTHIWQYLNWDAAKIKHLYGNKQNLEIYEGMAKWVEIQYAYLINERQTAKREEMITRLRNDPYGFGFVKYADVYPLSTGTRLMGDTPFNNIERPL